MLTKERKKIFRQAQKDKDIIIRNIREANFYDETYFKPKVDLLDETLTRRIKDIFLENDITVKSLYKKRSVQNINNYKTTLVNRQKMSWKKFTEWLDILDKEFELKVVEKKQKRSVSTENVDTQTSSKEKTELFKPAIHEEDELLNIIVKELLEQKSVCLKSLRKKYGTQSVNNFKTTLTNKRTMSWAKFIKWLEMLDVDYILDITDKNKGG